MSKEIKIYKVGEAVKKKSKRGGYNGRKVTQRTVEVFGEEVILDQGFYISKTVKHAYLLVKRTNSSEPEKSFYFSYPIESVNHLRFVIPIIKGVMDGERLLAVEELKDYLDNLWSRPKKEKTESSTSKTKVINAPLEEEDLENMLLKLYEEKYKEAQNKLKELQEAFEKAQEDCRLYEEKLTSLKGLIKD